MASWPSDGAEGAYSGEQLIGMVKSLLVKERSEWRPLIYIRDRSKNRTQDSDIDGKDRDDIARWLMRIHLRLELTPETFPTCLTILDRFLLAVRARRKYLRCIAISCYFLAAKFIEEDEMIPLTPDLVQSSECGCSVAEVLRMERTILSKLGWNLNCTTAFHFLHLFQASLVAHRLVGKWPFPGLSGLVFNLFVCSCSHEVLAFRPSTLAVALISLELVTLTRNWFAATVALQRVTGLDDQELICCREMVSQTLSGQAGVLGSVGLLVRPESLKAAAKRKAERIEPEDDIYEGIKRLYGDDANGGSPADVMLSCSSQAGSSANFLPAHVCAPV